jgi:hypothetical protein
MSREEELLAVYRFLMCQTPGGRELKDDAFCYGCRNHRPDWKYRYCVQTECPHMKGMTTFRDKYVE